MKNRIKKFYNDHKEVINPLAACGAGTIAIVVMVNQHNTIRGLQIIGGGMLNNEKDDTFIVELKNGSFRSFTRPES